MLPMARSANLSDPYLARVDREMSHLRGCRRSRAESLWTPLWPRLVPSRHAPGDVLLQLRDLAGGEEISGFDRICGDSGFGGVPDHQRQVLIVGILSLHRKFREDRPALFHWHPLKSAGNA